MSFLDGDEFIGAHLSGPVSVEWLHAGGPLSVFPPDEEIRHFNGSTVFHYLWDFLSRIPDAIADINLKSSKKKEMVSVIVDETNGPIIIHESATIEPFRLKRKRWCQSFWMKPMVPLSFMIQQLLNLLPICRDRFTLGKIVQLCLIPK